MNASLIIKKGFFYLNKHSPWVLMGLGTAGFISSTVFAIKATPKALLLIEQEEKEKNDKLTAIEVVKVCWKPYLPMGLLGLASLACFFGAHGIDLHRAAILTSAYAAAERTLSEYRHKVIETFGKENEKDVRKAIAQEHAEKRNDELASYATDNDRFPCLDEMTGQIFASNRQILDYLEVKMRDRLRGEMYVSKNEWLRMTGQRRTNDGDELFWTESSGFELSITPSEYENGLCYVVDYDIPPKLRANIFS